MGWLPGGNVSSKFLGWGSCPSTWQEGLLSVHLAFCLLAPGASPVPRVAVSQATPVSVRDILPKRMCIHLTKARCRVWRRWAPSADRDLGLPPACSPSTCTLAGHLGRRGVCSSTWKEGGLFQGSGLCRFSLNKQESLFVFGQATRRSKGW